MDKQQLIDKVRSIDKEEAFSFFEDGKAITSRFNLQEGKSFNQGSVRTDLAKALYAIIANLSIFRAQGKERSRVGLQGFDTYFRHLVGEVKDKSLLPSLEEEKKKAMIVFEAFLTGSEKITMPDILAKAFPLLVVKFSLGEEGIDRKIFQDLSKGKEVIFNQTALFVRSLFHCFLTLETTDPFQIKTDIEHPDAPYFLYGNTLMIATDKDAFTLSLLKEEISANLSRMPGNFSLKEVDSIATIFLLREIFAVCSFR